MLGFLQNKRCEKIVNILAESIESGSSVLDIGCGNMAVAKKLSKVKNLKVKGLDILDYKIKDMDFSVFDGEKIPFHDNSFDYSLFVFVLHHTENQEQLLKEAVRVSKKIIVLEDVYSNRLDLFFLKFFDKITNHLESPLIPLPYNFHSVKNWKLKFKKLGLNLKKSKDFSMMFPVKNVIFVLDNKQKN